VEPILIFIILAVAMLVLGGALYVRTRDRGSAPTASTTAPPAPSRRVPEAPPAAGLRARLDKTRRAVGGRLGALIGRGTIDDEFWSDLEDTLVAADVGVAAATDVIAAVRTGSPQDGDEARSALQGELVKLFAGRDRDLHRDHRPAVVLVVGVNGGGKTTSIAKLAAQLRGDGAAVILGAADTFRAAADQQLRTWADRVGVELVGGQQGADPASVAFDAYQAAKARGADVVIVDTAGRLQNKANLMDELGKVARVLRREAGDLDEVLLVLDGTTGQNAIAQARSFTEAVWVTGIVITKLDGTAKGGVAVAVERELGIPVKYIGVGEGIEDLVPFDPEAFVDALLGA
jgi:fused signal recognition particle receptor